MSNPTPRPCMVLIATDDGMAALERQTRSDTAELVSVSAGEPLRALEIITTRLPEVVVLDAAFAVTPRGAALLNRIKADPALARTEVRVLSPEGAGVPQAVSAPPEPRGPQGPPAAAPLDRRGTRRAPRYRITGALEVLVDGNPAALVDISSVGAQVVSPTVLRPNQRVRVVLPEGDSSIRCAAVVAWASFEIPPKTGPRYRAGLEFFNADPAVLDAFCARHGAA